MALALALFTLIASSAAVRGALERDDMSTLRSLLVPTAIGGASAGAAQVAAAVLVCAWHPPDTTKRDAVPVFGRAFGGLFAGAAIAQLVLERISMATVKEVAELPDPGSHRDSGGWGSTGYKALTSCLALSKLEKAELREKHAAEVNSLNTTITTLTSEVATEKAKKVAAQKLQSQAQAQTKKTAARADKAEASKKGHTKRVRTELKAEYKEVVASIRANAKEEANAKLLLGFPLKDGSFPVGRDDLNCGGSRDGPEECEAQFALVSYGVNSGFPLSGVFEWTADTATLEEGEAWNDGMRKAMEN